MRSMWIIEVEDWTCHNTFSIVKPRIVFKSEISNCHDKDVIHSICDHLKTIYKNGYKLNVWKQEQFIKTVEGTYWPDYPN